MKQKRNPIKWFHPKVVTGWRHDMPEAERRQLMLTAHKGDTLAAGRASQALANVSQDKPTMKAALSDAHYFYEQHRLERRHPIRIIKVTPPISPRVIRITPPMPKLR